MLVAIYKSRTQVGHANFICITREKDSDEMRYLYVFVQQLISRYSLWWKGTVHDKLALHGTPVNSLQEGQEFCHQHVPKSEPFRDVSFS